ncbi:MAG: tetratricopeptide repeat protein [Candidatus Eisenbacteria bacterium]
MKRICEITAVIVCTVVMLGAFNAPARSAGNTAEIRPNSQAYLHYSLGRLLEVSGALNDALVQYRRADLFDPDHCEVSVAVARTLHALGRLEEASDRSGEALELCPDNLEAIAVRCELLLVQGESGEAERILREVALGQDAPRELAALYGQALLSQGRTEDGAAYLRSRSDVDSLDPDIASMHGRALLILGDSEGAISELGRSLRLDPGNRAVAGMLSRLLIALERPEEGVPLLEWILSRYRALEPEFISLAAGYSMLDEPERAQAVLDTASARFGDTAPILRARGAAYYGAGDLDSAVETYEKLLELDEDSVTALNFIAYTLADEERDLERAADYAVRAVALEPDNPLLRDTLGWTHFKLGSMEEARRELDLAIELGGDNPVILEHLGDVLLELGLIDRAVAVWTRALELSPGRASTIERIESAGATTPEGSRESLTGETP